LDVAERRVLGGEEGGEADGELGRVGRDGERAVDFFEVGLLDALEETIVV
jgi:hypothetical protein